MSHITLDESYYSISVRLICFWPHCVMPHICMSHVTHINELCQKCECITWHIYTSQRWVMSHIWMRFLTHTHKDMSRRWHVEFCRSYARVMSHIWMSHVTHIHQSCHHVTHIHQSCHTYESVMSHVWVNHVTRMNESCHPLNESCHTGESYDQAPLFFKVSAMCGWWG